MIFFGGTPQSAKTSWPQCSVPGLWLAPAAWAKVAWAMVAITIPDFPLITATHFHMFDFKKVVGCNGLWLWLIRNWNIKQLRIKPPTHGELYGIQMNLGTNISGKPNAKRQCWLMLVVTSWRPNPGSFDIDLLILSASSALLKDVFCM